MKHYNIHLSLQLQPPVGALFVGNVANRQFLILITLWKMKCGMECKLIFEVGPGYSDKFPRPSATQHTFVPVFIVHTTRSLATQRDVWQCLEWKVLSFWEGCDFIFSVQCNVAHMSGHRSWLLASRVPDTSVEWTLDLNMSRLIWTGLEWECWHWLV